MRYSIGLMFVLARLVALPQSVNAQGDQRTEQEPALDLEWLEGSDLQCLQWLLEVEQRVEPERPTWPPPPPLSEGSWLRIEGGFAGMRVVPRPPPKVRKYSMSRGKRIGIGVGVGLGVAARRRPWCCCVPCGLGACSRPQQS
jgi:hypothetical protein